MPKNNLMDRRHWLISALSLVSLGFAGKASAKQFFRRVPTQYIAALDPPEATSGTGAETWGIWRQDPGPIGVWLRFYKLLRKAGNIAPAGWRFDIDDWWLDENGLIMRSPDFPISAENIMLQMAKTTYRC